MSPSERLFMKWKLDFLRSHRQMAHLVIRVSEMLRVPPLLPIIDAAMALGYIVPDWSSRDNWCYYS
jgi:hypothetical protein